MSTVSKVHVAIIGAGTAGLSAGYVTASKGYSTTIFGTIETSNLYHKKKVKNYLGVNSESSGAEILNTIKTQALSAGANFSESRIVSVSLLQRPFELTTDKGDKIFADSIIVATGNNPKQLEVPGNFLQGVMQELSKKDSSWQNKNVVVVGSGDDAVDKVMELQENAKKVTLLVRGPALKTNVENEKALRSLEGKVDFLYNSAVKSIIGDGQKVTGVELEDGTMVPAEIVVVAIGRKANTELFTTALDVTPEGYIKTAAHSSRSSVEGVFAAGACVDKLYGQKQALISSGEGMTAGYEAFNYLREKNIAK